MTEKLDIPKVGQALKIRLPQFFIDFHQQKTELIQELISASANINHNALYLDAELMVKINRDIFMIPTKDEMFRKKLCIGDDGCGNYVFISLIKEKEIVYFLDHDVAGGVFDEENYELDWEHVIIEKYKSIEDYVNSVIEIYK